MSDDSTFQILDTDPEMRAAIEQAQSTLNEFFDAFENPQPGQKHFLLKFAFDGPNGEIEHIWIADLDLSTNPATGTIANEPRLPDLHYKQRITLNPSRLSDWMFYDGDTVVGAFTTRVLESRLGRPQ